MYFQDEKTGLMSCMFQDNNKNKQVSCHVCFENKIRPVVTYVS